MAISVPIELHKEITNYVKKSNYNSIAEFVKDSVRKNIYKQKLFKELNENALKNFPKGSIPLPGPDGKMVYGPGIQDQDIKDRLERIEKTIEENTKTLELILHKLNNEKSNQKNNNTHGLG